MTTTNHRDEQDRKSEYNTHTSVPPLKKTENPQPLSENNDYKSPTNVDQNKQSQHHNHHYDADR